MKNRNDVFYHILLKFGLIIAMLFLCGVTVAYFWIVTTANKHISLQCGLNDTQKLSNNLKAVVRLIRNLPKNIPSQGNPVCPCAYDRDQFCHTSDRFCESSTAEKSCSQVWNNVVITSVGGITDPTMTIYDYGHPTFSGTNCCFLI